MSIPLLLLAAFMVALVLRLEVYEPHMRRVARRQDWGSLHRRRALVGWYSRYWKASGPWHSYAAALWRPTRRWAMWSTRRKGGAA